MKKVICSQKAPGAIGPYSQAIEASGMVFVSGQLPIDAATGVMAEGAEAQARQSLEIFPPEAQRKAFAAARRFCDRDLIFDERGEQRQRRLHEQQPRHAQRIEEHGGHGHHQHLEYGIEHGGNRVALFLRPLRQDERVKAAVGQLVKGAQS